MFPTVLGWGRKLRLAGHDPLGPEPAANLLFSVSSRARLAIPDLVRRSKERKVQGEK